MQQHTSESTKSKGRGHQSPLDGFSLLCCFVIFVAFVLQFLCAFCMLKDQNFSEDIFILLLKCIVNWQLSGESWGTVLKSAQYLQRLTGLSDADDQSNCCLNLGDIDD